MWWKKAPFFRILPAFIGGIFSGWTLDLPYWLFFLLPAIGFALIFLNYRSVSFRSYYLSWLAGAGMQLLYFSLGAFLCFHRDPVSDSRWYGHILHKNDTVLLRILEVPVEKTNSFQSRAELICTWQNRIPMQVKGKILVYFKKQDDLPLAGSLLSINKSIDPVRNSGNPGEFDFKKYCKLQGISGSIYLEQKDLLSRSDLPLSWWDRIMQRTQLLVRHQLIKYIPGKKEYGLAEALLIGYRGDIDKDLSLAYSNTGTVHIIAISGMHLALIYALLMWLLRSLPEKGKIKWLKIITLLAILWAFSFLCGAQPSILRATISFSFVLIAKALNRRSSAFNSLAGSAFFLLCLDPYYLFDPGFQLSFAAISSILLFHRSIRQLFDTKNRIIGYVYELVSITLAAQVLTFPVSLYHFHQFPVYFLFSNLLAVPVSGIILVAEIILLAVSPVSWLAAFSGRIISMLIGVMNGWIEKIGNLPGASIREIEINGWQLLLIYLLILFLSLFLFTRFNHWLWGSLIALIFFAAIRSFDIYQSGKQQRIIVYDLKNSSQVEYQSGRKAWLFFTDPPAYLSKLKKSRDLYNIHESASLSTDHSYLLHGKQVLISSQFLIGEENMPDLLILHGKAKLRAENNVSISKGMLVVDNTVPFSATEKIERLCDSLHIPAHVVRKKGAFIIDL